MFKEMYDYVFLCVSTMLVENRKREYNPFNFKTGKLLIIETMAKKCRTLREKRGKLSNYSAWLPDAEP